MLSLSSIGAGVLRFFSASYRNHVAIVAELATAKATVGHLTDSNAAQVAKMQTLSLAHQNLADRNLVLQSKLDDMLGRECPTCLVLKQAVNSLMLASGSRMGMFDGVGPHAPAPKDMEIPDTGKHRGRSVAKQYNAEFEAELAAKMEQQFRESLKREPVTE